MRKKNQQENILKLLALFEERDRLHLQVTEEICTLIGPTALEALIEIFAASPDNVTWLEVQLIEDVLLLVASIAYHEGQPVPETIQMLSPLPDDGQPSIRLFRVGLPVELIFQPKVEILDYLEKASQLRADQIQAQEPSHETKDEDGGVEIPVHSPRQFEFDTSDLTHEQKQQLLVFGVKTKDTKH